ncbi:hypothetical protein GCM10029964_045910 [Kibdelosporangium lantanae]
MGSDLLDDPDIQQMVLPAIRGDYTAAETYRVAADVTVACPITALCGDTDPKVAIDEAQLWRGHTTGGFELKVFAGDHFYIDDNNAAIMTLIRAHLATLTR